MREQGPATCTLNSSHTHSIVSCYLAGWVLRVPAGNEKLPVVHTGGFLSWGQPMREHNEYVARVAVCEQRAKDARTESEKQSWLVMADSWRETVNVGAPSGVYPQNPDASCRRGSVMNIDTISADWLLTCPCCGQIMRFARAVPKVGDLPEMQTFECRLCRLAVTAEQVLGITEMLSL